MMELVASYEFNYNESGATLKDIYPMLVDNAFTLLLQCEDDYYIGAIKYNYGSNWLSLSVYDKDSNIVQGESYVASFPTNLLSASLFRDYALFYYPKSKLFKFYKINSFYKWYNSVDLSEDEAYDYFLSEQLPNEKL